MRKGHTSAPRIWWMAVALLPLAVLAMEAGGPRGPAHLYTATAQFVPDAWACGADRFPRGAAIRVVEGGGTRNLAPGFFASADPEISFDGKRVLFAGRRKRDDVWQIWEAPLEGGEARRVAAWAEDSIRPLYLPDDRILYARKTEQGFQLETLAADGKPVRITFAPGGVLPGDVLHDGRVLYESARPGGAHELYTVYPDGSGVEAYRCDHGAGRSGGRQLASGDVVFASANVLARFTSALAVQTSAVAAHGGEFAGPIAETPDAAWLAA